MKHLRLPYNYTENPKPICSFAVMLVTLWASLTWPNPCQRGQIRSQSRERCVCLKWALLSSQMKAETSVLLPLWLCAKLTWRLFVSPPAVSTARPNNARYDSGLPAASTSSTKGKISHSWPRTADIGGPWRNGLHNVMSSTRGCQAGGRPHRSLTAFCSLVSL